MNLKKIKINDLLVNPTDIWLNRWFVLTAGTEKQFNSMAVGWGSFGGMWGKPFAQIVVRPGRYTYEFLESSDSFTLCSFPAKYKSDVNLLGTKSGRDCDKINQTKLTVTKSSVVDSPSFKEADLIIECKKNYWQDMEPDNFLDSSIINCYPKKDFHRIYFGEILTVLAEPEFVK